MEQNYLLTYKLAGKSTYGWFETQADMQAFIDGTAITEIFDALEINVAIEVPVDFTPAT